jgi:multisubunit Na+/H+ antiporter MnhG subunit
VSSDEEPVVAPDQLKPGHRKAATAGAIFTIIALLLMILGNQQGRVELIWLVGTAAVILGLLLFDWFQRRNGLK